MSLSPLNEGEANPTFNPTSELSSTPNAYDLTPYIDLSYVSTHPDRLAMMARLLGRHPAPVKNCMVLEVSKDDATLTTDHPLTVAAFEILAQVWPRAPFR